MSAAPRSASNAAPTAALIIIGAEVLAAKVDDANGPFLLRALRARGVEVVEMRTIGDSVTAIAEAVRTLAGRADFVLVTGGIGPTHDDVTVAGVAAAFDLTIVRHAELERRVRARWGGEAREPHFRLAEIPFGATVALDKEGILPVIRVRNVFLFAGVPSLLRQCFARIADELGGAPFYSRALLLKASEPQIADILTAAQRDFADVAIGSYPRMDEPRYRVKVTFDGRTAARVAAAAADVRAQLDPDWIVGEEGPTCSTVT